MTDPVPEAAPSNLRSAAHWLGLNRATVAVLIAIGGLGFSEEIWSPFLALDLTKLAKSNGQYVIVTAVGYMAVYSCAKNFLEGIAYILGGTFTHRLGAGLALFISSLPMCAGFAVMLLHQHEPWALVAGALLITNWEPMSVPATFQVVGAELPKNRRTIAFAMQSIQKRLPKVAGPLLGGFVFAAGYWVNLSLALGVLCGAMALQLALLKRMKPKDEPVAAPLKQILRDMPPELRMLLRAEILLRWGDWFIRDFASLYVLWVLIGALGPTVQPEYAGKVYGSLIAVTSFTALLTYIPVGKLVDRAPSPKPFIGITFFLFALFPFLLVLLPKTGLPVLAALTIAFVVNGLRELGEPARKSMIANGFPKEVRGRAVGLYWGLRSFAFFPAPIVSWLLWRGLGPDATFLIGGSIGMLGTLVFWLNVPKSSSHEKQLPVASGQ